MSDLILKRIDKLEKLLLEINSKMDNFLGFEELNPDEKDEVTKIREEIKSGEYMSFKEAFE